MRISFAFSTLLAAFCALPLFAATPAYAGIEACGDIDVEAHGTCEVKVDGCDISCTPITVESACAAKLEGSCEGMCPQVPSLSCTGSCEADCDTDCNVKPAEFDCSANCKADATAKCSAQCAADANQGQCTASCKATFAAECDASCTGKPGSASCTAKCQGRCEGSCTAQSKLQCQVTCQGKSYASCKNKITGNCTSDCANPRGALFCDGEYIDHAGTVDQCITALRAALPTITIDASAQSEGSCMDNSCEGSASGQVSTKCSFSPSGPSHDFAGAFAVFAALGAVCLRRRRAA